MMIHRWLAPHLVLPLHDRLTGQYAWREARQLKRLQWLPLQELKHRALAKLRPLLKHAYEQVPHYRMLFDEAGLQPGDITYLEQLCELPITAARTVKENYDGNMLAQNLPVSRRIENFTSGSSGLPRAFFSDTHAKPRSRASFLYFRSLAGVEPWDATLWLSSPAHLRTHVKDFSPLARLGRRWLVGEIMHHVGGGDFNLPDLYEFVEGLPADRGYYILTFPSFLGRLLRQIEKDGGFKHKKPKAIICYAHTMPPGLAQKAGQALNCRVYNLYSSLELYFLAMSCPDNPGLMHINTERGWLQVVDSDGNPCEPGQTGRIVITDYYNYVMPLINYDIGDQAVVGPACGCGRGFPTLQGVEGRTSEYLRTADGSIISPSTATQIVLGRGRFIPYIWEYQICQHSLSHITLSIIPTAEFTEGIRRQMLAYIKKYLAEDVLLELKTVDNLAPDEISGKRPVIVSHLPHNCL